MHEFEKIETLKQALNNGAFITSGENVMVASWGMVGVMWNKKVYVVPIRESRYTKKFVDETKEFTVSIPYQGTMSKELMFCGRHSGRDYDKWKETGLEKVKAKKVNSYVVNGCEKYYECRVIEAVEMPFIPEEVKDKWYPDNDKHTYYIAEIVEEY